PPKKLQAIARPIALGVLKILTLLQTSTMRHKVLFALLALLVLGCTEEIKTVDSLLEQLPQNPTVVIKINNLPNFRSELKNNSVLTKIKSLSPYRDLFGKLDLLEHVSTKSTCLLALYEVGRDNYGFVMVVPR